MAHRSELKQASNQIPKETQPPTLKLTICVVLALLENSSRGIGEGAQYGCQVTVLLYQGVCMSHCATSTAHAFQGRKHVCTWVTARSFQLDLSSACLQCEQMTPRNPKCSLDVGNTTSVLTWPFPVPSCNQVCTPWHRDRAVADLGSAKVASVGSLLALEYSPDV